MGTTDEAIHIALKSAKMLEGKLSENRANDVVARGNLHGELGYHDDGNERVYNLDEQTRDRLIVHGRQDAAHALLNTISLLRVQEQHQKWNRRLLIICVVMLAIILIRG